MRNSIITTKGVYTKGVIVPKIKPSGKRSVIITFLPPVMRETTKSDEKIWKEIESTARKMRKKLFKKYYPGLYAKLKGKSSRD